MFWKVTEYVDSNEIVFSFRPIFLTTTFL